MLVAVVEDLLALVCYLECHRPPGQGLTPLGKDKSLHIIAGAGPRGAYKIQVSSASSLTKVQFGGYVSGWIKLRSVPITFDPGFSSANWMAHVPEPVPMSRTSPGSFGKGAALSFPSSTRR